MASREDLDCVGDFGEGGSFDKFEKATALHMSSSLRNELSKKLYQTTQNVHCGGGSGPMNLKNKPKLQMSMSKGSSYIPSP